MLQGWTAKVARVVPCSSCPRGRIEELLVLTLATEGREVREGKERERKIEEKEKDGK